MKLKLNNIMGWASLLFSVMLCSNLSAQQTIRGTVTDANSGEPLIGASILVVGTSSGNITDFDGTYTIEVPEGSTQLQFSYTGYKAVTVDINGRSTIDMQLESGQVLDEVVVIGYGTVKKDDATGAVLALDEKSFNKGIITSPEQLIQGRASGVQITPASGEPGAGANIRIRGVSSIRSGNDPLIVLDGVPLAGGNVSGESDLGGGRLPARNPLNFINPGDIESINILKDASATAIYGSRGSNGVIIITTKEGSRTRPELTFSAAATVSNMPSEREYDLLTADQFSNAVTNSAFDFGGSSDAFDEIMRSAISQQYSLTYGSGTETGSYRFSLGAQDQEGIIRGTGLERYNATARVNQKAFNDRLTIDGTFIGSFVRDEAEALTDNIGFEGDVLISALRWNPTRNLFNSDGSFNQTGSPSELNPLAYLGLYDDETETQRIFGNISANFQITESLSYKFNFGVDRTNSERRAAVSRTFDGNFVQGGQAGIGTLVSSTTLYEHTLNYVADISSSINLNAIAGFSYQEFNRRGSSLRGSQFLVDEQNLYVNNLNFANQFLAENNNSFTNPSDELQSFFGRTIWDISGKYQVTATVRADGSSRFGEGNRYGVFPSAAVAWRLSEEDFIPDAFDNLKLRVSWGITGNQEFPSGSSQTQFRPNDNGDGITQNTVGNPDLKWEETTQVNAGIDFGFFNYRLTGSVDYYSRETDDLLFRVRVAAQAPDVFVFRNLDGLTVTNTGVDLELNGIIVDKANFGWDVGVNVSLLNNEVDGVTNTFPAGIETGALNGQGLTGQRGQLIFDGEEINAFYLPVFEGFDNEGLAVYTDLNGDGAFTGSSLVRPGLGDRAFVGSPNPDLIIGIRTALRFGEFDFSLYGYGNFGQQVYDNTANAAFNEGALQGGANVDARVLSRGQDSGDIPIPSTFYLEDADFFRIANATLGYNFRGTNISWLNNARVFITGQNLFVFTGYNGFDPEVNNNSEVDGVPSFGIDYSSYPRARSFTFGLDFVF